MSKLVFLGTAGSDAVLRQLRGSGGIVFQFGKYQIHLDPGPGALVQAVRYGINPGHTNVILCSHHHLSHCNDLNIMIDGMSYQGLDARGVVIGDESVIYGAHLEKPIIQRRQGSFVEQFLSLHPGKNVSLGGIQIFGLKTKHSCQTGLGFKIVTNQFTYAYTGDTSYFPELYEKYEGTDVLIVNNVFPFDVSSQDNLSSQDTVKLIGEIKPRLVIMTHFGKQILKQDPIYDARRIQQGTGVRVVAAKDGLILDPLEYIEPRKSKDMVQS